MKLGLTFILILSSIVYFSQDFDNTKVSIKKLEMNTSLSEISSDYYQGDLLFFQNKRVLQRYSKYYDLFKLDSSSLLVKEGTKRKESLTKQLSIVTNYHEGPCFIDAINNKIYITINTLDKSRMKAEKRNKTLDNNKLRLIEGNYQDGVITNIREFGFNNPTYNIGHATFSNQTNRLYFSSDMPGSIGKSDIYYCDLNSDGNWTIPVRLEGKINTTEDEFFPYIKNGILFFSSNAHDSTNKEKDLDIYYINENEISAGTPKPLKQINSEFDDFGICFDKRVNSFKGFFTSNRKNTFSENDDIYSFSFSEIKVQTTYDLLVYVMLDDKPVVQENSYLSVDKISSFDTISSREFKFDNLTKGKLYTFNFKQKDSLYTYELSANYKNGLITDTIKFYSDSVISQKKNTVTTRYNLLVNLFLNDYRIPSGNASVLDKKDRIIIKNIPSTKDGKYELTNLKKSVKYKFVYKNGTLSKSFDLPYNYESGLKEVTFRMESDLPFADSILDQNNYKYKDIVDSIPLVKSIKTISVQNFENKEENNSINFSSISSFENVYFAFDSYKLDKASIEKLNKLVEFYSSGEKIKYILLNAYTDSRGNKSYNDRLSVNRALSCRKYLLSKGIKKSKIKFVGFGELNLTNDCEDGVDCPGTKHARNRRVEISILN